MAATWLRFENGVMLRTCHHQGTGVAELRTPDTAEHNPLRSEFANHAPANLRCTRVAVLEPVARAGDSPHLFNPNLEPVPRLIPVRALVYKL
jgi:hypothetical protein